MLGILQVLKPIKWQDLLEDVKDGRNTFRTGAKIHFSNKNILGLGALQHFNHVCYADGTNDTLIILQGYAFFS